MVSNLVRVGVAAETEQGCRLQQGAALGSARYRFPDGSTISWDGRTSTDFRTPSGLPRCPVKFESCVSGGASGRPTSGCSSVAWLVPRERSHQPCITLLGHDATDGGREGPLRTVSSTVCYQRPPKGCTSSSQLDVRRGCRSRSEPACSGCNA